MDVHSKLFATKAPSVFNQRGFTRCLGALVAKNSPVYWVAYTCLLNCSIAFTKVSNSRMVVYTFGVMRTPLMFSHSIPTQ